LLKQQELFDINEMHVVQTGLLPMAQRCIVFEQGVARGHFGSQAVMRDA
jgi:hypothetical protein